VTHVALEPLRRPSARARAIAIGVAILLVAIVAGLLVGPVDLGVGNVLRWLVTFGHAPPGMTAQDAAILGNLRLPRVIVGGLVGASLSASGAAYQAVFRNPLADPYLLGAAAGAGLGATLVVAYGPPGALEFTIPVAAFVGAVLGVSLAYALGRSGVGGRSATSLVLAGVAVASFLTAVQTFLQQQRSDTLRQVYTWILGRLGTTGWDDVRLALPSVALAVATLWAVRRLLDVIEVGDVEAHSLGLDVGRLRAVVVIAASLATAAAVAVGGLIGFVGIIVPHTVRLLAGGSYRAVLPLSVLFGASFLILVDLLARTVVAPGEIPIGVITAFVGAPFFVAVLRRGRGIA
jgi:iron complex transport system permease protein